jgi:amino acid permease
MLTSALGPGCLSLPYRAGRLGLVMFVLLTMACAALSYLGMYFMERIIVRYKVPSYSEMVRKAFGERITKLAEIVLITYPLAITISVQVIFSKFITQLLTDIFGLPLYSNRELEVYNDAGSAFFI